MLKKMKKNQKGFTLVELVVVIAILAVLSALLVPRIMGNVEEARHEKEVADARTLASEIAVYNAKAGTDDTDAIVEYLTTPADEASLTAIADFASWAGNFPLAADVLITIDADGNPTVDDQLD